MLPRLPQLHPRALVTAGVAIVVALFSLWLLSPDSRMGTSLERASYDWSQDLLSDVSLSNSPVVIVYLDLDSYVAEKQNPIQPWSRALHAQLLNRLTGAGAKAVVFDIIFDQASTNSTADVEFASALRANGKAILAGEIGQDRPTAPQNAGVNILAEDYLPATLFLDSAAGWGMATLQADNDFVVRRFFETLPSLDQPSLSVAAAKVAGIPAPVQSGQWLRYYGWPLAIPYVSYTRALHTNEIGDDFFRNKIVFVGARPVAGAYLERKDEFRSPFSYWGDTAPFMPAVEVHATQMLNVIRGDSLHRLSARQEVLILLGTAILFTWLLFRFRPLGAAGVATIAEGIVFAASVLALNSAQTWFPWLVIEAVQIPGALAASVLWQSLQWYQQRRRFEAQRRADEAKIREQAALIEKAQDAIFVQEIQGDIIYANPSAERLYGWSTSELAHSNGHRIPIPDRARQAALATGEWLGELEQTTRDGRRITVASRCTLIKDDTGRPKSLMFINTDVTEKKRLEQEFFRAQRAESVGSLASGMAHDLNNAFAPILMGLQLLQRQRQDTDTQRMLSVMEQNTHRGADMVRQVLLFCRGSDSQRQPLLLGRLLREMEQMIRQTFPRSINVAALVPADLWPVLGNATQLHQVLLNLCVNARDAMPNGGELTLAADNVELTATEAGEIPRAKPGAYVMLLVSDTGSGIPPEILPRIFEPFFTTKPADRGTGLGLSTVARIISQHDGFLNVKSELNQGTTFEIYLPRAATAPAVESKNIAAADSKRGHGELILVADDDQSVLEMVSLTLGEQGYRVITAANGAEAAAKLESNAGAVRLALLDTDMPILNGPQALSLLRAHSANLPIVLMSGEIRPIPQEQNVRTLAKPFQLHELLDAVAKSL